mmetsp:Transcript_12924/g.35773  ORF Transcript_12924/g.35773 Transcript_12924/m.35773 type:complete len:104 (-) Transcript_12924:70-381(-)
MTKRRKMVQKIANQRISQWMWNERLRKSPARTDWICCLPSSHCAFTRLWQNLLVDYPWSTSVLPHWPNECSRQSSAFVRSERERYPKEIIDSVKVKLTMAAAH